jgi:enoyl-[acyl-carrier-protein] reductase (NADH)
VVPIPASSALGGLGVWVNYAGTGSSAPVVDLGFDEWRDTLTVGRPASAHEIAHVVVFLADPGSTYVTGTSVVVDGGLLLMAAVANQLIE